MSIENYALGARRRIHGELLKLGFAVSSVDASPYMAKDRGSPVGQSWGTSCATYANIAGRAPKHILNTHPSDQRRRPASMRGRSRFRDFQRQYRRKPARCQRTSVSGRMIVIALRIARKPAIQLDPGNQRYSWMKKADRYS